MKSGVHRPSKAASVIAAVFCAGLLAPSGARGQSPAVPASPVPAKEASRTILAEALPPQQWKLVEKAVDRALAWISTQQERDGSFSSAPNGQPAVTSLCVLAFLSRGHQPGHGPYGRRMERAIDYVLGCQQSDGLWTRETPEGYHVHLGPSHTASYNHAIAGLMLTEVFGSTSGEQAKKIKESVRAGLEFTRRFQHDPAKAYPEDEGGWRYVRPFSRSNSDLSVTSWQLMFLRSAKNAEFKIPDAEVEGAMGYVQRCFEEGAGCFTYGVTGPDRYASRPMTGAGILALSLGGMHQTEMARRAGEWLLAHPFTFDSQASAETYGIDRGRFHYAAYYCSLAMAQLGGRYWREFFPKMARTFLEIQSGDGSWPPETGEDAMFGAAYSTALSVLALTPPLQMLPIYQR
jgi:hypothetical protein